VVRGCWTGAGGLDKGGRKGGREGSTCRQPMMPGTTPRTPFSLQLPEAAVWGRVFKG